MPSPSPMPRTWPSRPGARRLPYRFCRRERTRAVGSWPCENSGTRRARRNISKKLRISESNHAARMRPDAVLENCIFYISPMYEFSHSQGHSMTSSTRASTIGGTSRSSVFATIRLTTRSNLVGCSTRRSVGFAPAKSCRPSRRRAGSAKSMKPTVLTGVENSYFS